MACITCGKQFDSSFFAIVKRKKDEYDKNGTIYYVYRKDKESAWSICRKEYFKEIMEKENPEDFFHIAEFKPD